mgnify:CR=1 FL=1
MKKFFLILLSISLFSCINSIYENRVSDKEEAEIITNQFFDYLKNRKEINCTRWRYTFNF